MTMILHIENPKDATRKLVELINEFSKVIGYRINTQKSFVFLYTNNEKSGKKVKEMIPFPFTTKRIKHPGINYLKRQKICMKKTIRHWWKKPKTTQKDGDIYHFLGLEKSKWLYYPKQTIDLMP